MGYISINTNILFVSLLIASYCWSLKNLISQKVTHRNSGPELPGTWLKWRVTELVPDLQSKNLWN